jgi:hypothetical protein
MVKRAEAFMDTSVWIIISLVLAAAVIVLAAMLFTQRRRSGQLQQRFGPEYDRSMSRYGSQKEAEEELIARERRVNRFKIVPLSREDAARFSEDWRAVQNCFVDDPKAAVEDADRKVRELMQRRGYPMGDFEQRAADLSVHHAEVVEHYRAAHQIAVRNQGGNSTTEDLKRPSFTTAPFSMSYWKWANRTRERTKKKREGLHNGSSGKTSFDGRFSWETGNAQRA